MKDNEVHSRPLQLDKKATANDPNLPAFLSRPEGKPIYHGFPLIEETRTNGWCFGAITEFEDPEGCESGDGFVVAPDGQRAGLVWDVGENEMQQVAPPEEGRWGVYAVWFPRIIRTVDDLVFNFRFVLPSLRKKYEEIKANET